MCDLTLPRDDVYVSLTHDLGKWGEWDFVTGEGTRNAVRSEKIKQFWLQNFHQKWPDSCLGALTWQAAELESKLGGRFKLELDYNLLLGVETWIYVRMCNFTKLLSFNSGRGWRCESLRTSRWKFRGRQRRLEETIEAGERGNQDPNIWFHQREIEIWQRRKRN